MNSRFSMGEANIIVLLSFIVILMVIIFLIVYILRPSNVRKCIESEEVVQFSEVDAPAVPKAEFRPSKPEISDITWIIICIVATCIIFIISFCFINKGVRDSLISLAKFIYKILVIVVKSIVKYIMYLLGSVSNLPQGLKTLYFYVFLIGALVVFILYGVYFIKDFAGGKLSPLVGGNKIIQGWGVAAMLTCILMLTLTFVIMMGYVEKNSKAQKLIIKSNIVLLCFLITCVIIVMEGKSVEEYFEKDDTYYDKFYNDGKKDPSFIVHACLTLFGVLVLFVTLYSFVIHDYLIEDCNNLYDKKTWTMYINGSLDDVQLDTDKITSNCITKYNEQSEKLRKRGENELMKQAKAEAKELEKKQKETQKQIMKEIAAEQKKQNKSSRYSKKMNI
jgi:hypothetical protein